MDRLAGGLFESFGITDHGVFLRAAKGRVISGRFDSEGEEVVAVTEVSDFEAIKPALGLVDFSLPPQDLEGAQLWKSADGDFAAASIGSFAIVGDAESVVRCIKAHAAGSTLAKRPIYPPFTESIIVTIAPGPANKGVPRGTSARFFSTSPLVALSCPLSRSSETKRSSNPPAP